MIPPVNPYIAGNPVRNAEGFFGRRDLLDWVSDELLNPSTDALVIFAVCLDVVHILVWHDVAGGHLAGGCYHAPRKPVRLGRLPSGVAEQHGLRRQLGVLIMVCGVFARGGLVPESGAHVEVTVSIWPVLGRHVP